MTKVNLKSTLKKIKPAGTLLATILYLGVGLYYLLAIIFQVSVIWACWKYILA